MEEVDSGSASKPAVGSRQGKRHEAARGVKRKRDADEMLIEHVASMSEAVTELVKGMKTESHERSMEEVDARVKEVVKEQLKDTQKLLAEQSAMIKKIYSFMRGNGGTGE